MTQVGPPGEGESRSFELKPIGTQGEHTFTNETVNEPSHADKIPHNDLTSGKMGEHTFKVESQGFFYWLWNVLAKFIPFISPPPLYRAPEENISIAYELNELNAAKKEISDPEVQRLLTSILPEVAPLSRQWQDIQGQPLDTKIRFLNELGLVREKIAKFTLGDTAYVETTKQDRLHALDPLIDQVKHGVYGEPVKEWRSSFAQLQKFPIDQDPSLFLNFSTQLAKARSDLSEAATKADKQLSTWLKAEVAQLDQLQTDVKQEIFRRQQEVKQSIEQKMPQAALSQASQETKIPLQGETFAAQYEQFALELSQKKKQLLTERENKSKQLTANHNIAVDLQEKKEAIAPKREVLKTQEESALKSAEEEHTKSEKSSKDKFNLQIKQIKEEIESLKGLENELNAKKQGRFFRAKITVTEEQQLNDTTTSLLLKRQTLKKLEEDLDTWRQGANQRKQDSLNKIKQEFISQNRDLDFLEKNSTTQIADNETETNNVSIRLREIDQELKKIGDWEGELGKLVQAGFDPGEIGQYIRLAFLQKIYPDFEKASEAQKSQPSEFIQQQAVKHKTLFEQEIKADLKKLGVAEENVALLSKDPLQKLELREVESALAKELKLEKYL